MRLADKVSMAWNSLLKRKLRTLLTVLGVMIGVASIVTMMGLAEGLNRQSMELIEQYGGLRTVEVREGSSQSSGNTGGTNGTGAPSAVDPTAGKLSDETIKTISRMEHVESVYPTLEFQGVIISGAYTMNLYGAQAMPLEVLRDMNWEFAEGEWPEEGDELKFIFGNQVITDFTDSRGNNIYWNTGKPVNIDFMKSKLFTIFDMEAYEAQQAAKKNTETVKEPDAENTESADGDKEAASAPAIPKKYSVPTAGVLKGSLDDYSVYAWNTYCDLEALKKTFKKVFKNKPIPGQPVRKNGKPYNELYYSKLSVIVDEMDNVADVQKAIGDLGYQATSNSEWIAEARQQSQSQQAMLGGIGAVSLLVAAIGIANTMMMSIYERTKEIGVMKVIGCGLFDIQQMFLIEAGMIGAFGGVTGLTLSLIVCIIINKVTGTVTAVVPLWMYPASIVFAIIVSMAAGYAPSKRAMSLSALEAIRSS